MSQTLKVTSAAALVAAGVGGAMVLLSGEGLDRAEKWVSIAGVVASVMLGGLGLVVAWFSWRRPALTVSASGSSSGNTTAGTAGRAPGVDAREAKGSQFGDHNTQHNTF
ncbi:hypothetical protein [Micromonospora zamorensis]|uniref:hypothetical protein n=1 Tax=Micromonospora zamorensis TaxID=709883 RepID=UPI0037B76A8F